MNSSETSAKYSWPNSEQKEAIQDSGGPEEVDMLTLVQLAGGEAGGGERNGCLFLGRRARGYNNSGVGAPNENSASKDSNRPKYVVQGGMTFCPGAKSLKGRSLSPRIRSHGRGRGEVAQTISGAEHYLQARGKRQRTQRRGVRESCSSGDVCFTGPVTGFHEAVWVAVDVRLSRPEGQSRDPG